MKEGSKWNVVLLLPAAFLLLRNLSTPLEGWIGDVPDDAFFYPVIARNILAGHGFSMDGLHPTTGFHLPWLALLVALAALFQQPEVPLWLWLGAYGLLILVAAYALGRAVGGRAGALAGGLCALAGLGSYGQGTEMGLWLCCFWVGFTWTKQRWLSVLLGATRIDFLPWLGAWGWRSGLGGLLGIGSIFAFNQAISGQWRSTAMQIKSMGGLSWNISRLDIAGIWRHFPTLGALGAGLYLVAALLRQPRRGALEVVAGIGILHLALEYLMNGLVGPWYLLPLAWALLAVGVGRLAPLLEKWPGAVLFVVWLLRMAPQPGPGLHGTVAEFARQAQQQLPPDALVLSEDFPGILAYVGHIAVFPADGLAGPVGWDKVLLNGEVAQAAQTAGAHWYIVSRRRKDLGTDPTDTVQPPFIPVPPSEIPLQGPALLSVQDPSSGRYFSLYALRQYPPDGPRIREEP